MFRFVLTLAALLLAGPVEARDVRVLAVVTRFADGPAPTTVSGLTTKLVSGPQNAKSFWLESSYGQINLVVTVWPVVISSTYATAQSPVCGGQISSSAMTKAGIDVSLYDMIIRVEPHQGGCNIQGGYAYAKNAVLNGSPTVKTLFHEVGHVLGIGVHASGVSCPLGTAHNCTWFSEYGNPADVMGALATFHLWQPNTYYKTEFLKVLPADRRFDHVSGAATYTIRPAESATGKVAVRVQPNPAATCNLLTNPCLWIEYRAAIGYDATANASSDILRGGAMLNIVGKLTGANAKTYYCAPCLIHTHNRQGATTDEKTYGFPLKVGESYHDEKTSVTVTVDALTPDAMTVTVRKD